jgi:hypothetical protein
MKESKITQFPVPEWKNDRGWMYMKNQNIRDDSFKEFYEKRLECKKGQTIL